MQDSIIPTTLEHLFFIANGTGAWQHYNYYLENYTDLPKLTHREDTDNLSSLYCAINKSKIAQQLALDIFGADIF